MAVKKANKVEEKKEDVQVEVTVTSEETKKKEEVKTPEVQTDSVPEVEISTEVEKKEDVQVDIKQTEVNEHNKPEAKVKIRMRCDHRCTIAMEHYDLKAGKVYIVPSNVKNILNRAGLLAPL